MNGLSHRLNGQLPQMIRMLEKLVAAESPSDDVSALNACAEVISRESQAILGVPPEMLVGPNGQKNLMWRFGNPRVGIVGHYDTVWPTGTVATWPFTVEGENATGPGVFDMKAGIVQLFYGLAALESLDGVAVLLTCDEEIGAPSSLGLIEELARSVQAVLVIEPSEGNGRVKVARKGIHVYRVDIEGRASHSGLEPEAGVNALTEMAHQVLAIQGLGDSAQGTTVTPTGGVGGAAINVVPGHATFTVDVRALSQPELDRVDAIVSTLHPVTPEAQVTVTRVMTAPALPRTASEKLFARAQQVAHDLGLPPLEGAEVGGGSDGNFTAAIVDTLDGLGAVGGNAHAKGEYIDVAQMPQRAALLAGLVTDLLNRPLQGDSQ